MSNWTARDLANYARRKYAQKGPAVAGLPAPIREPDPAPALDRKLSRKQRSKGRAFVRVTIVSVCRHLRDSDSIVGAYKHLRDAIAETCLGIDDGNPGVAWEYDQILTQGETGTLVKIERIG